MNKAEKKTDVMSEEDKRLEKELHMLVDKILKKDASLYGLALETLRKLIRTSTTSVTSVPLPLKFLRSYYLRLKDRCETIETDEKTKALLCSVVSILAMGQDRNLKDTLRYCLRAGEVNVGDWGHEYVRQLETEVVEEWNNDQENRNKLLPLIKSIVAFDMKHNAEIQACDLLMEIDRLDFLQLDKSNYLKICLYLINCSTYVVKPERTTIYNEVIKHYLNFEEYPRALCLAMSFNDTDTMSKIFVVCQDPVERKQLAYMLARQSAGLKLNDESKDKDDLTIIMSNSHINEHFINLARELDILEPKTPDDVYKTWLEGLVLRPSFNEDVSVDSARHNLASTFVNAFVNAGFSSDKLVSIEDGNKWMYKNKQHGMLSAAASLGLIYLWDVDGGLTPIDKYLYTPEEYIKAGALLALGIVNVGVRNECDPAYSLLSDYVLHESASLRIGAVLGLGLAYAGTRRQDVITLLLSVISDNKSTHEVVALAALSCGMISVGADNQEIISVILQIMVDLPSEELQTCHYTRFLPLALGLCYLGHKDKANALDENLNVLVDPFKSMAKMTVKMCACAGSGDVLTIQELLHICSEHYTPAPKEKCSKKPCDKKDKENHKKEVPISAEKEKEKEKDKESASKDLSTMQAVAALAVAVVAMGEDTGSEMCTRIFGQLGRYGEPPVRRAVPLAIALLSISNPQMNIIDVLNKYSHDLDEEVAHNAIFAMGLVGAGSNNARLATMLRHLAQYHADNTGHLFMIRIAQGLTHMGKGTLSLSPFHTDRQVMNPVAVSGLLIPLFSFLDTRNIILAKSHYLLYTLVVAMYPKWLVTLNENLEPLPVLVRVGQAVDVIGKAGTPKTIAGGHTFTTPVLLAVGDRAELATDEYKCLTPIMEGLVILRKNQENE